jgi:hypothetical protein
VWLAIQEERDVLDAVCVAAPHRVPRDVDGRGLDTRRAASAARPRPPPSKNPREWRQLEQLVDSCAWLSASVTVPVGAINATGETPSMASTEGRIGRPRAF